jgi:hypothetical protein
MLPQWHLLPPSVWLSVGRKNTERSQYADFLPRISIRAMREIYHRRLPGGFSPLLRVLRTSLPGKASVCKSFTPIRIFGCPVETLLRTAPFFRPGTLIQIFWGSWVPDGVLSGTAAVSRFLLPLAALRFPHPAADPWQTPARMSNIALSMKSDQSSMTTKIFPQESRLGHMDDVNTRMLRLPAAITVWLRIKLKIWGSQMD